MAINHLVIKAVERSASVFQDEKHHTALFIKILVCCVIINLSCS